MSVGQKISRTRAFALVQDMFTVLPDRFRDGLLAELKAFEPKLLARMKVGVPTRSGPRPAKFAASRPGRRPPGGLRSLLTTNVEDDELRLRAGLLTPSARGDGFYGFILDAGRGLKRQRSRPRRRQIDGSRDVPVGKRTRGTIRANVSVAYSRRISPIQPGRYDITFGRVRDWARDEIGPVLTRVYDRAVRSVFWSNL